jgi:hypothetical protein
MASLPEALSEDIRRGRIVLLLGSGASIGAKNEKGREPLNVHQLRDSLALCLKVIGKLTSGDIGATQDFFFLAGTFSPFRPASDRPIAMACFLFVTFLPERPDLSFPRFISCIARSTFCEEPRLYFFAPVFFAILSHLCRNFATRLRPENLLEVKLAANLNRPDLRTIQVLQTKTALSKVRQYQRFRLIN